LISWGAWHFRQQELQELSVERPVLQHLLLVLGVLLVIHAELWPSEASGEDWRGPEVMHGPLPNFSLASPGVFRFLQKVLGLNSAQSWDINWMIFTRQQLTLYCKFVELKYGMQE
jgi:hypothetical protein